MKIGLLTMHAVKNFGSFLQTYATLQILRNLGHEPFVINYISPNRTLWSNIMRVSSPKWKRNILSRSIYRFCYLPEALINHILFGKCIKKEFPLTKVYHSCEDMAGKIDADAFIVGSDKVWSFSCNDGLDQSYFLRFTSCTKKISYSSSIGDFELNKTEIEQLAENLKDFSAISVREFATKEFLSREGLDVSIAIDPVLMLSQNEWLNFASNSKLKLPKRPYLLMYMFGRETDPVRMAAEYAKSTGFDIVRIGWDFTNRQYCKDVRAYINPYDFVKLFANAQYVVTNSFHGTAFSILFNKQFSITRDRFDARFAAILELAGLESRFHNSAYSDITISKFDEQIDYSKVNKKIDIIRQQSRQFINKSLQ